jgi:CheY-like chemotaxis protein
MSSSIVPPTVMVIDDDLDIREIITEILTDAGYEVVPSSNGVDALDKLRTVTPSLILLDLNMPIMDGVAFRRAQCKDPVASRIPTVVMSAVHAMQERVADLGVNEALTKPVNLKQLLDVVARYCGVRREA